MEKSLKQQIVCIFVGCILGSAITILCSMFGLLQPDQPIHNTNNIQQNK